MPLSLKGSLRDTSRFDRILSAAPGVAKARRVLGGAGRTAACTRRLWELSPRYAPARYPLGPPCPRRRDLAAERPAGPPPVGAAAQDRHVAVRAVRRSHGAATPRAASRPAA